MALQLEWFALSEVPLPYALAGLAGLAYGVVLVAYYEFRGVAR